MWKLEFVSNILSMIVVYRKEVRGCSYENGFPVVFPLNREKYIQFEIFNPLSYCFEGTIGFDVKASFASRPESRLIRWYNEPGDITKEFW